MAVTTWNPSKRGSRVTLSNSNKTATTNYLSDNTCLGTTGKNSGMWCFEIALTCATVRGVFGVGSSAIDVSIDNFYYATDKPARAISLFDGQKYYPLAAYSGGYVSGDIFQCRLNFFSQTVEFGKNGTWNGVAFSDISQFGTLYPLISSSTSGETIWTAGTLKTTSAEMSYPVPDGYTAWDDIPVIVPKKKILVPSAILSSTIAQR